MNWTQRNFLNQLLAHRHGIIWWSLVLPVFISVLSGPSVYGEDSPQSSFQLTIHSGSTSGTYPEGQGVFVWPDPAKDGANLAPRVFAQWSGDVGALTNSTVAFCTFSMPSRNVDMTAVFKDAPLWEYIKTTMQSQDDPPKTLDVNSYFPPNHRAIMFLFHGRAGSSDGLTTRTETLTFARAAVSEGFAVIIPESNDRVNGDWQVGPTLGSSVDFLNVQALIEDFTTQGLIRAGEPIVSVGGSDGGGFSTAVSHILNFPAACSYIASAVLHTVYSSNVPLIIILHENDEVLTGDYLAEAQNVYQDSLSRGVPCELYLLRKSPLYPERFWRIPGITVEQSRTIYNILSSTGALDASGYVLQNPGTSTAWWDNLPAGIRVMALPYKQDIEAEMKIAYAGHEFSSDWTRLILNFIETQLPVPATPTATMSSVGTLMPTLTPTCTSTPAVIASSTLTPDLAKTGGVLVYPSPAKGTRCWFYYQVRGPAHAQIKIYNLSGQLCSTLEESLSTAGYARTSWDLKDIAPGVYLYRLRVEEDQHAFDYGLKKMVVIH